jgi:hypothetical protein
VIVAGSGDLAPEGGGLNPLNAQQTKAGEAMVWIKAVSALLRG